MASDEPGMGDRRHGRVRHARRTDAARGRLHGPDHTGGAERHRPYEALQIRDLSIVVPIGSVRSERAMLQRPPAPEVVVPTHAAWPAALTRPASPARLPVVPRPTVH
jgi:hypothetical protein